MDFPWDVFGVGAALGGTTGLVAGYQLRKLVVRFQRWRRNRTQRITKRDLQQAYGHDQVVAIKEERGLPPVIPLRGRVFKRVDDDTFKAEKSATPDRDEVIAALTGAGYKKADAVKAVDACSLAERASGPEHWTIAALRHAHGAK